MLTIGEFSKLSLTTVKALRFYEKEGLLTPFRVDKWTGYRLYETSQLETAAKIKSYRQLGLSIEEIRAVFGGGDERQILSAKAEELKTLMYDTQARLSAIRYILEGNEMMHQITVKDIPEAIVYYSEKRLKHLSDKMTFIPACGEECLRLNPNLKCAEPDYEFCEYPDEEYKNEDVLVRHNQAVTAFGNESDTIRFRKIPAVKVLSIYHKGAYEQLGSAYAFIVKYAEDNGYEAAGLVRERYIDGIWNRDSEDDWLTEIQLPIR